MVKSGEIAPLFEKKNPFTPDMPVEPHLFAGRKPEIAQISKALDASVQGSPQHLLIQGERWIGKTSIARYAEALAQMHTPSPGDRRDSFFVSFCSLGSCATIEDICLCVLDSYKRMSNSVKDKVLKLLGSVEGITIGPVGVSLSRSSGTSRFRVAEFPRILEALLREATNKYQAFLLIMDETERVSGIPHMASLLKDTLEHLQSVL